MSALLRWRLRPARVVGIILLVLLRRYWLAIACGVLLVVVIDRARGAARRRGRRP